MLTKAELRFSKEGAFTMTWDYSVTLAIYILYNTLYGKHGPAAMFACISAATLLLENACQVIWCFESLPRRGAKLWDIYDAFEHLAERLAYTDGGFGRRLYELTFISSSEGCAFCCGDLSHVGL